MDPKIEGRLRCRYITNNAPFLLLQPIKMEEAYLKPRIVIYHDVITEDEIETVKKMAQPRVSLSRKIFIGSVFPILMKYSSSVQTSYRSES